MNDDIKVVNKNNLLNNLYTFRRYFYSPSVPKMRSNDLC